MPFVVPAFVQGPSRAQGPARAGVAGSAHSAWRTGLLATVTRALLAAGAAFVVGHLTISGRPATVCPLRALTGIPCPFCGGTTAAAHLGHGDVVGALAANPFVVIAGAAVVLAPALLGLRGHRRIGAISATAQSALRFALIAGVIGSQLWQLVRFGIL